MSNINLYLKVILLLILEYKKNKSLSNLTIASKILEETRTFINKNGGIDNEIEGGLKDILANIINGETKPTEDLIMKLEFLLSEKPNLYELVKKYSNIEVTDEIIENIKNDVNNLYKKIKIFKAMRKLNNKIMLSSISSDKLIDEIINELKPIKENNEFRDEGLVEHLDFDNVESIENIAMQAKELMIGNTILKTGWNCINIMTQGGIRRGEFVMVSALQHNYKSGFVKSLFAQFARLNKPIPSDNSKKPLLIFISLEENLDNILYFFYLYLKYSIENIVISKKELEKLDHKELALYVKDKLTENGYSIKILRYRPDLLTFTKLESLINQFENDGYEIHACIVDYVKKMNRSDIIRSGAVGTDLLELYSRIRNLMSSKKIAFITPHQLSTEAKKLDRMGIRGEEFVKLVAGRGYYADSGQLDQEVDMEIFLSKERKNGRWYLAVQRGKHRIPSTIDEDDQFTYLEFPKKSVPIPECNEHHKPCYKPMGDSDDFDF